MPRRPCTLPRRSLRHLASSAVALAWAASLASPVAAQMVPVSDPASLSTAAGDTPTGRLYLNASDTTAAAPEPAPAAPRGPAAQAVILPPRPKPLHDLPRLGGDVIRVRPFRAVSFGLTASTLGPGAEVAIPVSRTLNLRAGGSYLNLSYPFSTDGINYSPGLKFVSGRATLDWFPHHGGFHVSAGALYFKNNIAGAANIPAGRQFTLGDTTYINSVDDPVGGRAALTYGKRVAPLLLLGFGNMLPRSGRHISVPIEIGGAYMQPPSLTLALAGTACTTQGCFNAATDPQVQHSLSAEVTKLQGDIRFLQIYPIVSIGLACRF